MAKVSGRVKAARAEQDHRSHRSRVDAMLIAQLPVAMESPEQPIMQQPIRKVVGRQRSVLEKLAHMEDLTQFLKQSVQGAFTRGEGDYFRVRKSVGRPREERG